MNNVTILAAMVLVQPGPGWEVALKETMDPEKGGQYEASLCCFSSGVLSHCRGYWKRGLLKGLTHQI